MDRGRAEAAKSISPGPSTLEVRGDLDDVAAAMYASIGSQEVAILSEQQSPDSQQFKFLTIRDEPGVLIAHKAAGAPLQAVVIDLSCSIGYFGDPVRERRLLEAVAKRISDLAGVDYRPIR